MASHNFIDLIGKKFNEWNVLERVENGHGGRARWLCECSCEKKTKRILSSYSLTSGHSKSCGCFKSKKQSEKVLIDLTMRRFGKLLVIVRDKPKAGLKSKQPRWICLCDCGRIKDIEGPSLRYGLTTSCGCHQKEIVSGNNSKVWKGGKEVSNYDTYAHRLYPFEEVRRHPENNEVLQVKCTYCGQWITPTRSDTSRRVEFIEGKEPTSGGIDEARFYCKDSNCRQLCPIYGQVWVPKGFLQATSRETSPELRKMCFERDNWTCLKCGVTENLHCHHIDPVINNPIENADLDNVMTVCSGCHADIHKKEGCKYHQLRCDKNKKYTEE